MSEITATTEAVAPPTTGIPGQTPITFQVARPRTGWQKGLLSVGDDNLAVHTEDGVQVCIIPFKTITKVNRFGIEFSIHNNVNKLTNIAFGSGRRFLAASAVGNLGIAEQAGTHAYLRSQEKAAATDIEAWSVFFKSKGFLQRSLSVSAVYKRGWAWGTIIVGVVVILGLLFYSLAYRQ